MRGQVAHAQTLAIAWQKLTEKRLGGKSQRTPRCGWGLPCCDNLAEAINAAASNTHMENESSGADISDPMDVEMGDENLLETRAPLWSLLWRIKAIEVIKVICPMVPISSNRLPCSSLHLLCRMPRDLLLNWKGIRPVRSRGCQILTRVT